MDKQIKNHKNKSFKCCILGIMSTVLLLTIVLFCNTTQIRANGQGIEAQELGTGNSSYANQVVDFYESTLNVDIGIELAATISEDSGNGDKVIIKKIKGIDLLMSAERSLNFLIQNQEQITGKEELDDSSLMVLYFGAKIKYDETKVAGNRVISLQINEKELDKEAYYKVAMSQTLADNEDYPEIRDSKEEINDSTLLVKEVLGLVMEQNVDIQQEESRYELKMVIEKNKEPNIYLMVLSTVITVGLGVVGGWLFVKSKQKNNL